MLKGGSKTLTYRIYQYDDFDFALRGITSISKQLRKRLPKINSVKIGENHSIFSRISPYVVYRCLKPKDIIPITKNHKSRFLFLNHAHGFKVVNLTIQKYLTPKRHCESRAILKKRGLSGYQKQIESISIRQQVEPTLKGHPKILIKNLSILKFFSSAKFVKLIAGTIRYELHCNTKYVHPDQTVCKYLEKIFKNNSNLQHFSVNHFGLSSHKKKHHSNFMKNLFDKINFKNLEKRTKLLLADVNSNAGQVQYIDFLQKFDPSNILESLSLCLPPKLEPYHQQILQYVYQTKNLKCFIFKGTPELGEGLEKLENLNELRIQNGNNIHIYDQLSSLNSSISKLAKLQILEISTSHLKDQEILSDLLQKLSKTEIKLKELKLNSLYTYRDKLFYYEDLKPTEEDPKESDLPPFQDFVQQSLENLEKLILREVTNECEKLILPHISQLTKLKHLCVGNQEDRHFVKVLPLIVQVSKNKSIRHFKYQIEGKTRQISQGLFLKYLKEMHHLQYYEMLTYWTIISEHECRQVMKLRQWNRGSKTLKLGYSISMGNEYFYSVNEENKWITYAKNPYL